MQEVARGRSKILVWFAIFCAWGTRAVARFFRLRPLHPKLKTRKCSGKSHYICAFFWLISSVKTPAWEFDIDVSIVWVINVTFVWASSGSPRNYAVILWGIAGGFLDYARNDRKYIVSCRATRGPRKNKKCFCGVNLWKTKKIGRLHMCTGARFFCLSL